jgi:hypothetical protein
MIFVDTGAWFARFVPDDPDHRPMAAWFAANNEPLITSDYCVDKVLTLLVARKRPNLAAAVARQFFDESLARLHFLSRGEIERASIWFQERAAVGWSFTDCTSKVLIDEFDIRTAAALNRHFQQFGVTIAP